MDAPSFPPIVADRGAAGPGPWPSAGDAVTGTKQKVLVMDDDPMIREVVQAMLLTGGHQVACAKDGDEAIAMYVDASRSEEPFSVVIMDLTIPGGMGGKEAVGRLRKLDSAVRAVASSGYSDDPVLANFREHGFDAVIPKPFRLHDLEWTLGQLACPNGAEREPSGSRSALVRGVAT
jgi:CheY-like chemotaxis protein